ncbi:hypothetical protein [Thioclava sp. GXIMD4215]|uniref:hypothetical protein n=1 Tax=Thioclava sp. GXIMD4215 TaxID=3131928 RepID=UPI0032563DD2
MVRKQTRSVATNEDYALLNKMRDTYASEKRKLDAMRHWHIANGTIYLSTRINRNIDVNNFFLGDDEDYINRMPTNAEGADWLNAVMGDWMARSGIPGASADEEFSDNWSSRIAWGGMNIVFGAAEFIGGVALTAGTLGWGTVAGGALSLAGFEAITQGIDMWRTPNEAAHSTGWLGDATYAMMNKFGVLEQNDQAAFNRYWSFAMLGLSLGGAGVLGYAGKAVQAGRVGQAARQLDFIAEVSKRTLASARTAIVGVKGARFGQFIAHYAALPSGRIAMNIQGVGRIVAPHWESLTRLRLRMNTAEKIAVQERRAALAAHEAGFLHLPNGVKSAADAQKLVDRVYAHMGLRPRDKASLIAKVTFGGETSSFNAYRELRITSTIGTPRNLGRGGYNEFIAMNEVCHELIHAQRLKAWVSTGKGSAEDYWKAYPRGRVAYYQEEVFVETTARAWTERMVRPRIEKELKYGSSEEAKKLQAMLDEFLEDSKAYIDWNKRRAGQ